MHQPLTSTSKTQHYVQIAILTQNIQFPVINKNVMQSIFKPKLKHKHHNQICYSYIAAVT